MKLIHELSPGDDIWFRASEHNIAYPAVVKAIKDNNQKAVVQVGEYTLFIDNTYEIVLV